MFFFIVPINRVVYLFWVFFFDWKLKPFKITDSLKILYNLSMIYIALFCCFSSLYAHQWIITLTPHWTFTEKGITYEMCYMFLRSNTWEMLNMTHDRCCKHSNWSFFELNLLHFMPMVLRFHFLSVPIQNCTTDISVRLIGLPMTGLFYMVHTRNHRNGHIFQIIGHNWCFVWVQNKHEKKKKLFCDQSDRTESHTFEISFKL